MVSPSDTPTTTPVIVPAYAATETSSVENTSERNQAMDKSNPIFQEFSGYWRLSEEMIAKASKDELAESARILAMRAAHMTRNYGELQLA
jgi:hypothetical protein